jgi:cytoskeleton protein RodZ
MSNTQQAEVEQTPPSLGPGDRLQAARISNGLTLDDVASKMHLCAAILSSLEENDFDDITAPIFVKGYLRSYARIVNLDEEEIIKQYSQYYTHNDPPISSISNTLSDFNSDDAQVKGTTWLVIVILIGLLSFWWWSRYQQPTQTVSLDSVDSSELIAGSSEPSDSTSISLPLSENETTDSSQQEAEDAKAVSTGNDTPEITLEQEARNELNSINEILSAPEQLESVAQPEPVAQPEQESETSSEQSADTTDLTDLEITVNADTWADIKDADGTKLVYDLLKNGQRKTITGKAPFRVFLGNGHGVSIQYQGESIDISNKIRADNTARFKVGQ